jgi:beta-glucosidase-like glycosyl hydrolase
MFPSMMAIGATGDAELAYQVGAVTAREARAVGIHVPFAPVLDVNNNPDNPVINVRAFGEDPAAVSSMGAMFVRGIQDNGGIATGKHFPGHGDTDVDSHMDLPLITVDRLRLDSIELVPFKRAIEEGVGGIMTAHIAVPSITEDNGTPATLSENVLTTLLRGEMGFKGLIFTDAMDMAAIARRHSRQEAAVRAVLAGADVILMPPSARRAIEGVVAAVRNGRIRGGPPQGRDPLTHGAGPGGRQSLHRPDEERREPAAAGGHPERQRAVHHVPQAKRPPGGTLLRRHAPGHVPAPPHGHR